LATAGPQSKYLPNFRDVRRAVETVSRIWQFIQLAE